MFLKEGTGFLHTGLASSRLNRFHVSETPGIPHFLFEHLLNLFEFLMPKIPLLSSSLYMSKRRFTRLSKENSRLAFLWFFVIY